jgi:hypothetical protein
MQAATLEVTAFYWRDLPSADAGLFSSVLAAGAGAEPSRAASVHSGAFALSILSWVTALRRRFISCQSGAIAACVTWSSTLR